MDAETASLEVVMADEKSVVGNAKSLCAERNLNLL
jgi:hypothetical protein